MYKSFSQVFFLKNIVREHKRITGISYQLNERDNYTLYWYLQGPDIQHNLPSTSSTLNQPPLKPEAGPSSNTSPPPLVPLGSQSRKRSRLSTPKSRKMVTVNQMHQESLRELREIRHSVAEIASDIKRAVDYIINKE